MAKFDIPLVDLKAQHDSIKSEMDEAINRVISNSSFIMGEEVKNFENNFAEFCGAKHCIGASNGSTALFTVLKCLGIKEGDEIIMPVNTFVATAFAVTLCGGKPVFVDVSDDDFLIDVKKIEEKITKKTKIIIPVHLYGSVCDMDPIMAIAKKHNLVVVEDCAQCHGSKYKGKTVPVCGIGCFSFFPAKIIGAIGDAGAIVTDDDVLAEKFRKFVNHGRKEKYSHDMEGFNFRIDALQCAVLGVKLRHLNEWIKKRKTLANVYDENLKGVTGKQENRSYSDSAYYMYVINTSKRDELLNFLKDNGIETGIHYPIPLHLQPAFSYLEHKKGDFPVAEKLADEILSIPLFPELKETDQKKIVDLINGFSSN